MSFDMNTLTLKGAELLAASTVQNKLILDGCDAKVGFIDQSTAVNISARPSSPLSTTTDVSIIGSTAEHVMARAQWTQGQQTGGDANTLYLYGHSEQSPSDIYVIYICSSQSTFHLPVAGDVAPVFEALFDMIYACTLNSVTSASTSVYATLAEFNMLKERTVTTHKEQQPTVGENQTIYGDKIFKGSLVGNTILPETPAGNLGASNHRFNSVYSTSSDFTSLTCPTINFDSTGLRKIYADGPLKLGMGPEGTGNERYQTRSEFGTNLFEIAAERCDSYGEELDWSIFAMSQGKNASNEYNGYARMNVSNRTEFKLEYNSTADVSACTLESDTISLIVENAQYGTKTVAESGGIEINGFYYLDLCAHDTGAQIKERYDLSTEESSIELKADSITVNADSITVNSVSLSPKSGETVGLGTLSDPFSTSYVTTSYTYNLYPTTAGGTSSIGSSTSKFANLYASYLHGILPTPGTSGSGSSVTTTEPEVGAIILIVYEVNQSSMSSHWLLAGMEVKQGSQVTDNTGTAGTVTVLKIAKLEDGVAGLSSTSLDGKYRLLCDSVIKTVSSYYRGTALAIRIE